LKGRRVYVSAPFDVNESRLTNTFFTTWDGIKNNVILHWMDVTDAKGEYGLGLLTDHTTSYVHGEDHPLGLVLQYSGIGLWGRRYDIAGPTTVRYALVPHKGCWDRAEISGTSAAWNEPLLAVLTNPNGPARGQLKSMLDLSGSGWEVSAMTVEGRSRLIRLFNAAGDGRAQRLNLDGRVVKAGLVELNGNARELLHPRATPDHRTSIELAIPRLGVRTLKLEGGTL